jgi:hypothetical protein
VIENAKAPDTNIGHPPLLRTAVRRRPTARQARGATERSTAGQIVGEVVAMSESYIMVVRAQNACPASAA